MQKQSAAIVALLVLGLAAVAMSASVDKDLAVTLEKVFGKVSLKVCDICKGLVAQSKDQLPTIKPQLEQLCQYCGADENVQKCIKTIDETLDKLEKETPEQICTELGLCKKAGLNSILGL